ncbi:D-glycero-beta-D-manno-heptose 1-phosphate adenylyltransferase [Cesiribacter andamanensis]|uniref:D-glycero-beta-D-manno-heptose 1-phosphate adenylyltransferase n=1 Tax=Cesiribacter andamanensis AMV16 TaxID=1279009 RepID=M7NZR2_9BACT|nr:D-glycero-beta-D-manno-heptose 1-phosphate adenylyltransferase [Cesiribacter andamanensis]EMR03839.1 Bifunctional protein hldE [Cesiribacter andamanensis AMV16]
MRLNQHSSAKILSQPALQLTLTEWRTNGQRVVFTNGCFDLLHLGHVDYLEKASQLGDRLVIGINSDASVKRLKGSSRPLQTEGARARLLAALSFVDAVVLFEEDTPLELITLVAPEVLVKGDDYSIENIVGADVVLEKGGVVRTIPLVAGCSTTAIVTKIKNT